jgi:CheY-like chemotaxis protein
MEPAMMTLSHDRSRPQRILVVDDDELSRYVVARRLTRWGLEPLVFARAEAVLAYLQAGTAQALVTDFEMPELDGLALARAARGLHPALPVLLLTATRDPELEERARAAGVRAVVVKQAGVDRELRAVLQDLLDGGAAPADFELAHSLRTPLTALKSAIDILCSGELGEAQRRFAAIAQRNVDQMIVLVERLLEKSAASP